MRRTDDELWKGLKRPSRLHPGDAVAIVAPASPLKPGQRVVVERSLRVLEAWGLRPQAAPGVWDERGYLAGTDESRSAQLQWAFTTEKIRGVFCLRGGYGSIRVLPRLDPEILGSDPKIFVGASDLTAMLVYLLQQGRMGVFHGPTLACEDLSRGPESATARSLFEVILKGGPPEPILGEGWNGGSAEGPLVGGCLSVIVSLLGTPFTAVLDGAICFLEDVNEPLYRVDRMLTQLRLSGALDDVRGLVLGTMDKTLGSQPLRETVLDVMAHRNVPILYGVPSGHGAVNLTLPLGVRVRLDGDQGLMTFLEAGVEGKVD
jgi:muramoyltetrapeptide carboxypeptidase